MPLFESCDVRRHNDVCIYSSRCSCLTGTWVDPDDTDMMPLPIPEGAA